MQKNFLSNKRHMQTASWLSFSLPTLALLGLAACSGVEHAPDPSGEDGSISGLVDASVEGGVADGNTSANDAGTIQDASTGQDSGNTTVDANTDQDSGNTGTDASTASCQSDRQCNTGSICLNGDCIVGCRIDEDCPADSPKCENGANPPGSCVECLVGGDCQAPLNACINGSCTQTCNGPNGCSYPTVCDDAQGLCVRCIDNDQCLNGTICVNNDCVPGCTNDQGCMEGQICTNGSCVEGCRDDSSCLDGMICADNNCRLGCRPATDTSADTCPVEQHCDAQSLTCADGCGTSNDQCPAGETCLANACYTPCDNGSCPAGDHCDNNGYCVPGCVGGECGNNQVCDATQDALGECVECYEGDTSVCDNSPVSKFCDTLNRECTAKCVDQQSTFYCENILGWVCDANSDNLCVECVSSNDCNEFQHCDTSLNRCVDDSTRPFCAQCTQDADCGTAADLCVYTDYGRWASEQICTQDCSQGQSCPSGTACQPVGEPVRGMQCVPTNSVMDAATCAGRGDLIAHTSCQSQWECGLPQINDAICSGYGASAGSCSVFCDPNVANDCPEGFICEDPPAADGNDPNPRCAAIH